MTKDKVETGEKGRVCAHKEGLHTGHNLNLKKKY